MATVYLIDIDSCGLDIDTCGLKYQYLPPTNIGPLQLPVIYLARNF